MERRFEQVLDECLSQLNSLSSRTDEGGTVDLETILARYPEHADRLRPLLRVSIAVQATPHPTPSPAAKAVGRQRLLVAAARKRQQREAARRGVRRYLDEIGNFLNWVSQPSRPLQRAVVVVMAVLVVVAMTTAGVTQVAARSLPDTPLYPIKLASEQVQLALASSPAERARLHITFGERRLREAQILAQAGRPLNTALAEMVKQNKQAFGAIAQVPAEERAPLLEHLALLARTERQALNEVKQDLPLSDQLAVAEAIALSAEDQARAEEAQRNPLVVPLIPTDLPATLTPFVATATATLLPTATVTPIATQVEVVVPPPEQPERPPRPTLTLAPTETAVPTNTATPGPVMGEQPLELTPTVAPTDTPKQPEPTQEPEEPEPTVVPTATETPPFIEATSAPPATLPPP